MGYDQYLDNGVMKGRQSGPDNKQGKSLNFFDVIAKGENPNGQTTHAPGQVVQGGEVIYEQERYPRDFQGGSRWSPKRK